MNHSRMERFLFHRARSFFCLRPDIQEKRPLASRPLRGYTVGKEGGEAHAQHHPHNRL